MAVYIVKESFIYDGKIQNIGEEVQILEKDVIENCINRGLVEKKDSKKADTKDIPEETGVSDSESKTDKNKKKYN